MGPTLVAFSFAGAAHAQGTMDFSGAQTLMGTFKKDGKYVEHTEWHRCVVFGKLGEFAATLKKGAHIQVEGELRSREYVPKKVGKKQPEKKTIWEIRVNSILKLDRAAKASAEDNDESTEEEAA
jgi:single-strand DNA-binding protein